MSHVTSLDGRTVHRLRDEEAYTAAGKAQILADWQRFINGGFARQCLTLELSRFLCRQCLLPGSDRETLWQTNFNGELYSLRLVLNQFAGNGQSVKFQTTAWLDGPAADLKRAMSHETGLFVEPLNQLLDDLERQHDELGRAWRAFARRSGLADPGYPPHYRISENSRRLLAYAAGIVRRRPQPPGLQLQIPPPLLAPPDNLQAPLWLNEQSVDQ